MTRTLLIGTTKGAFLMRRKGDAWHVDGPHCDGWGINHVLGDPDTGTIWAGGGGEFPGAGVWRSDDGGRSWSVKKFADGQFDAWMQEDPDQAAQFGYVRQEPLFGGDLKAIWSLGLHGGRLYAGGNPAALFVSDDGGDSWAELEALSDHPSRDTWNPGGAGLILHTIVGDPERADALWIGISAAGVFATEDGGRTWERRNRLANAEACGHHNHPAAPRDGETGHCVHNMQRARDGTLYQQNHHGVWRSNDGGRSWSDINAGLPSTFGFPLGVHPEDPQTVWVLPLNGDSAGRYPPDASAAVWRSRDGGQTWQACRAGLPQGACYFTVLRQAMAVGAGDDVGVYFGTNTGSVFASHDDGDSWDEIARHLPTVLSVETLDAPR